MFRVSEVLLLLIVVIAVSFTTVKMALPSQAEHRVHHQPQIIVQSGDDRYTRAPRPLRVWDSGPDIDGVRRLGGLDSIATRGPPDAYQQMGVVTAGDGKVLPLYGRRVAARASDDRRSING